MNPVKEKYDLDGDFERVLLFLLCRDPKVWGRIGPALDPECFQLAPGKLVVETVRQMARESGRGPDTPLVVLQRIRRRVYEGKVTSAELQAVNDLFDDVMDRLQPLPSSDAVVLEMVPLLRRRLETNAILIAHTEWANKGDFASVRRLLEQASRVGSVPEVTGVRLGPSGFDSIEKMKQISRLPTGIFELDMQLEGGVPGSTLWFWLANSGGGKSMALVHQTGEAIQRLPLSGFITLELPEPVQLARLYANITGVPVNDIIYSDQKREEAKRRVSLLSGLIGICEVAEMSPGMTTVRDVVEWVDSKEQETGLKMQFLAIDYADKMTIPGRSSRHSEYEVMRDVYEGIRRDLAVERGMWLTTASQSSRPSKESNKRLDMHHTADSMHKARVTDGLCTINWDEESRMISLYQAKFRMGRDKFQVGPLPTDFERARLVPWSRELAQW